ncbi:MAG: hypothetical protein R3B46_01370 [Phycisphaerales bacterium]
MGIGRGVEVGAMGAVVGAGVFEDFGGIVGVVGSDAGAIDEVGLPQAMAADEVGGERDAGIGECDVRILVRDERTARGDREAVEAASCRARREVRLRVRPGAPVSWAR